MCVYVCICMYYVCICVYACLCVYMYIYTTAGKNILSQPHCPSFSSIVLYFGKVSSVKTPGRVDLADRN